MPPGAFGRAREALRHGDFRRLFGLRLASQCGDGLFQASLVASFVFSPERADTALRFAIATLVVALPYSILGPFAGVFIDRWSRRRILLLAPWIRAAAVWLVLVDPDRVPVAFFAVTPFLFPPPWVYGSAYRPAVKVSLGRYVGYGGNLANSVNPVNSRVNSATRAWNDANGDFVPQETELGPVSPAAFGTVRIVNRYATSVTEGFGNRDYNWQFSTGVQHELLANVAVNVSYFRTSWRNITATNNTAVASSDFDPYCVTLPQDARFPGGGGNQVCGLYDVKPEKFGQVNNVIDLASAFGSQTEVFNGVDATVKMRLPRGAFLQGGMSTGRNVTDNCSFNSRPQITPSGFTANTPRTDAFCRVELPWGAGTQIKLNGSYTLPYDVQASAAFQNLPGTMISASYVATNADIRPSLGRNLSGSVTQVVIAKRERPIEACWPAKVRRPRGNPRRTPPRS